jgi:hypothetical protein
VDAVGVDRRASVVEPRDFRVRREAFHLARPVLVEVLGDRCHSFVGAVEEVYLDVRARRFGEIDHRTGTECRDVAVDGDHGVIGEQEVGGRGASGRVGALDGALAEQVVVGLAAPLRDEALQRGDALLDALLDPVASEQRLVAGV